MAQTQLGCVVSANFTGDWIRADAAGTNFERSCAACHANVSCVAFSADTGSVGTPLTVRFDDVHPRRRRLQQQPPLESPPTCTPWEPFSEAAVAARCPGAAGRLRAVGCGSRSAELSVAVANANGLFSSCESRCAYDPERPLSVGWQLDSEKGCWERVTGEHECVQALLRDTTGLGRVLRAVARACPPRRGCEPAAPGEAAAAGRCEHCAAPQRHEPCFASVDALVRRQNFTFDATDRFDAAQAALAAEHKCPKPCAVTAAAAGAGAAQLPTEWLPSAVAHALQLPEGGVDAEKAAAAEWRRLVVDELERGWRGAAACAAHASRERPRGSASRRFVVVSEAREQMHKNKYVVADALFIAAALGRALVEPNVCDSRLGETCTKWEGPGKRSPTKAPDAAGRQLSLRHYWDLQPLCATYDLVPLKTYHRVARGDGGSRRRALFEPAAGRDGIGLWRLHTRAAVRDAFRKFDDVRVIELRHLWRSVTNSEAAAERKMLPYEGFRLSPASFELNPGYDRLALYLVATLLAPASGRYLAVQWRSEDWHRNYRDNGNSQNRTAAAALRACAGWAAAAIQREMRLHNLSAVFLATDLRAGASGTYHYSRRRSAEVALSALERAVPELSHPRLRAFIDSIDDAGVRANLEAAVCARATMMLTTTHSHRRLDRAARCSKLTSAYGTYIRRRRTAFHRPTAPLF